jgi:hypothetical protein
MTAGLLNSFRANKIKLHKRAISQPTEINHDNYTVYRNIYNKLIKLSKKLYFENGLRNNEKDPKKTWNLLTEATNLNLLLLLFKLFIRIYRLKLQYYTLSIHKSVIIQ